jgi:heme-degrading monooxygenase HmoA
MFSVIFEVHPKPDQWDVYLDNARMLRPVLVQVDGFIDNIRYKSLTREGWILSLSGWRDEKAVVRWRTTMQHHMVQEKGRSEILRDYRLRVGQITQDTRIPDGHMLQEQRLDETEVGDATTMTLIDARRPLQWAKTSNAADCSAYLGLNPDADGMIGWDVFDAVLTPGDLILLITWRTKANAEAFEQHVDLPEAARLRRVRIVRDYGMFDRREAPQYYPAVERGETGQESGA